MNTEPRIDIPTFQGLKAYLHYQFPGTQGNHAVNQFCDEVAALDKNRRVCGCGYCGKEIYECQGTFPPPPESIKEALKAFEAHDRICSQNPVAKELQEHKEAIKLLHDALQGTIKRHRMSISVILQEPEPQFQTPAPSALENLHQITAAMSAYQKLNP